jgi:transcriptional regulator with XRE-family HTH domain
LDHEFSQQALASQAGIALRTVANLEAGQDVSLDTLRKLAAVLNVTVAYLVGGS